MRISDWSSDVCSSYLIAKLFHTKSQEYRCPVSGIQACYAGDGEIGCCLHLIESEEDGETGNSEEQIDPVIPARKGEGHMLRLREHVVKTHAIMKNDDGQSSQATKRIQFLQSRLRPWFRCHEDELSQTGYDSRNAAAGKRPPIFLLDRQHRTAIPLAGSILSALSQSAAAQQSGCSGGTGHKGTAKQQGSPKRDRKSTRMNTINQC